MLHESTKTPSRSTSSTTKKNSSGATRWSDSRRSPPEYAEQFAAAALVFEFSKVEHLHIREAMVGHLRVIDENLAERVAAGLGMQKLPAAASPALPVKAMPPSPALQILGKMKDTLEGRSVAILIAEGSDGDAIAAMKSAVEKAGASVKIVAPKVGATKLADGSILVSDGQLAGTPSVLFDAVALILSEAGATALAHDSAAIDFLRDAFGHLKAIGADAGGQKLLKLARVEPDAGVVSTADTKAFIVAARTRQWDREAAVRPLP